MDRGSRFLDPQKVEQHYIIEKHSRKETAEFFNVSESVLKRFLKNNKILKPVNRCAITYEEFYKLYVVDNLTLSEIAEITTYTIDQLVDRKKKLGITKNATLFRECMSRISSSPEFVARVKETNIKKYGVSYAAQIPGAMKKRANNNLIKYGVENVMQLPENVQRQHTTNIQRYGGVSPMADPMIANKRIAAVNTKYGVDNVFQSSEIKKKCSHKYYYDGEKFDSSWELALWIYAKDHGETIFREPCRISFTFNGKVHYYFPDFYYDGKYMEIKGPHLLSDEGFKDIYHKDNREQLYQAKYQDMLKRDIIIMGEQEMIPYIKYVEEHYGKNYLRQFKLQRLDNKKTDCIMDLDF